MGSRLNDVRKRVNEGIEQLIEDEMVKGGRLEDVRDLVKSSRPDDAVRKPSLFMYNNRTKIDNDATGLYRNALSQIYFVSIVKGRDTEDGSEKADDLISRLVEVLDTSDLDVDEFNYFDFGDWDHSIRKDTRGTVYKSRVRLNVNYSFYN